MLKTEMRNPKTMHIDKMSTIDMVSTMAAESYTAVQAVEQESEHIAQAVDAIAAAFDAGHRLFFIGCGTSGRLGVLDAAECPPTFGVDHSLVNGIIAGGPQCMFAASENAEDKYENGAADIAAAGVAAGDVVVGISVAGGAAYVVGALEKARALDAVTVALTSNEGSPITQVSDISICTDTGAEVISGSTRLKAGTAHKMVMNILTTCAMVKTGKVYENLMINLRPTNIKLKRRMVHIVSEICECDFDQAEALLGKHGWNIRRVAEAEKRI